MSNITGKTNEKYPDLYIKTRLDANAAKINALILSLDKEQKEKYTKFLEEQIKVVNSHYLELYHATPHKFASFQNEFQKAISLSYL